MGKRNNSRGRNRRPAAPTNAKRVRHSDSSLRVSDSLRNMLLGMALKHFDDHEVFLTEEGFGCRRCLADESVRLFEMHLQREGDPSLLDSAVSVMDELLTLISPFVSPLTSADQVKLKDPENMAVGIHYKVPTCTSCSVPLMIIVIKKSEDGLVFCDFVSDRINEGTYQVAERESAPI